MGGTAAALEPTTPLASYGRQSWVMENGLPQNTVQALLQTRDGFVWLGTEVGLVRFDGIGFRGLRQDLHSGAARKRRSCLVAARDGSLWIGTSEGLARWKDGRVDSFTTANGLADNDIRSLARQAMGSCWRGAARGWRDLRRTGL